MNFTHKKVLLVAFLVVSLVACSPNKTVKDYIVLGHENLEQNDVNTAIILLKNAIRIDPNNAQARFLLGKAYAEKGLWLAAEKELIKALDNSFDDSQLLPLLAKVYYHLNDTRGIEELLDEYIEGNASVLQPLHYFLASSFVLDNQISFAQNQFNILVNEKDDSLYTKLSNVWLLVINNNFTQAITMLNELSAEYPNSDIVVELQARTLFAANKVTEAAQAFEHYLQLHPQDHQNRLMYALALARSDKLEEAEKQVDILYKITPNNILVNQIKAQARFAQNDFSKAKEFAERALQGKNDLLIARVIAGVSAYQLKQTELAYTHLEAIKDRLPFSHPARRLLTAIRFQLGYGDENFNELSAASLQDIDTQILSASARELFKVGQVDEAVQLMEKASKLDPDNAQLLYQRGILKLLENNNTSIELFKAALEKDPHFDAANVALVMKLIANKKYNEAVQITESLKTENPVLAYSLQGEIYGNQGSLEQAKSAFKQVLKSDDKNLLALFYLGKIAEQEGDLEKAVQYYQKTLTFNLQYLPALSALLQLSTHQNLADKIKQYFEMKLQNNPKEPVVSFALAKFYLTQKNIVKAQKILLQGLQESPKEYSLLLLLAKIEADLRQYGQALTYLDEITNEYGDNALLREYKSQVYLLQSDLVNAINELKKAVKLAPSTLNNQLSLIKLYIKNGELDAAKQLLSSLLESLGNNEDIMLLSGRIALLEHNYQQAITLFSDVYQQNPRADVLLLLLDALQKKGSFTKALTLISTYENDLAKKMSELPLKLRLKQAELYSYTEAEKAITIYKKLAQKTENHYVVNNNLAWLYLNQGDLDQALIRAESAIKSAPNNSAVQDTYGVVLLSVGQKARALAVLKNVSRLQPKKNSYKIHYVEALLANGKKLKAKEIFSSIRKEDLTDDSLKRYIKVKKVL